MHPPWQVWWATKHRRHHKHCDTPDDPRPELPASMSRPANSRAASAGFKLAVPLPYTSLLRENANLRVRVHELEAKLDAEYDEHDRTREESDACQARNAELQTVIERLQRINDSKVLKVTPLRSQIVVLKRTVREQQRTHKMELEVVRRELKADEEQLTERLRFLPRTFV